jgi:hypothetical protein
VVLFLFYWCPFVFIRGLVKLSEILFALSGIQPKIAEHRVHTEPASSISPKQGIGLMLSFERWYKGNVGNKKMIRVFLIGALFGVMITTAVTYVFAIPGNSNYWRSEIWKRGGAAWTADKNGHIGWKWMIEPVPDTPRKKPAIVPAAPVKVSTEQL